MALAWALLQLEAAQAVALDCTPPPLRRQLWPPVQTVQQGSMAQALLPPRAQHEQWARIPMLQLPPHVRIAQQECIVLAQASPTALHVK